MLKNYLKIAWKVLLRRKFFTFVSLFGISVTLMVLMVAVSFFDHLISPNVPDVHRERNLYLMTVIMKNAASTSTSQNPIGFYLANNFAKKLKTPERVSLYTVFEAINTFSQNKKIVLKYRYTDEVYWEAFQFNFVEGKGYNQQELKNRDYVAVISRSARDNYFGKDVRAVGKEIQANGESYKVIGVVEDVPITNLHVHGDLFLPYTISPIDYATSQSLRGNFFTVVQAYDKSDFEAIKAEYASLTANIDVKALHDYDILETNLDTYLGKFTRNLFRGENDDDKAYLFYVVVSAFMFFFMLLPAINLVNLNITRIIERTSEIGVRKAFGASNAHLVEQFLVENVAVTLIGGAIGIVLTYLVLLFINQSQFIAHMHLEINFNVFSIGLLICLFFGLLSGVYPAFRMSKLQAAVALKGADK
ncbi:MAG: ABC transporter permease [Flammeovirgaceae bacterium]